MTTSLVLAAVSLIGCQSKIIVSGVIVPITNLDIPRNLVVDVIFFDAKTEETKQVSARVNRSGRFTARVSDDELYLTWIEIPRDDLTLSTDWITAHPPLLKTGERLILTDLFLSYPFELTLEHEDSVVDSVEDLRVSWAPVEAAQLYVVWILRVSDERKAVHMFVTGTPSFDGAAYAPTIPFDRLQTMPEMLASVPFYRLREAIEGGAYEFQVGAFREANNSVFSIISRSKPLELQIHE